MRIHCTADLLRLIKNDFVPGKSGNLPIDKTYKPAADRDELYDWHAGIVAKEEELAICFVNDLTKLVVVIDTDSMDSIDELPEYFKFTLREMMELQSIPEELIEQYFSESEAFQFTKTISRKVLGTFNSVKNDIQEMLDSDSWYTTSESEFSLFHSHKIRGKGNQQYFAGEEWVKVFEEREQTELIRTLDERLKESNSLALDTLDDPASEEEWRNLYLTAKELQKKAPWEYFWDAEILLVEDPSTGERFYCSVIGREETLHGVSIFRGEKGRTIVENLLDPTENLPFYAMLHAQDSLIVTYPPLKETQLETFMHLNSLNLLDLKTPQPEIQKLEPGYSAWLYLDKEEVRIASLVLEQLIALLNEGLLVKRTIPQKQYDSYLARIKIDGQWQTKSVSKLPVKDGLPSEYSTEIFEDQLEIKRLKRAPRLAGVHQIELIYAPAEVQELPNQRPIIPQILLIFDKKTKRLVAHETYAPSQPTSNEILENVTAHLRKGLPNKIELRKGNIEPILLDLLKKLDIKVNVKSELDDLTEVIEDFYLNAQDEDI